ncbi:Oidioi.mRNA.OKI2018_I69.chr1.g909.t1.cds [Oikopleura dioica]|uniref:Oidioi.mRNA.OKI2018_I69.chr1.g909.t1.cds n=1 Tax=Oikopleura dioica TaxID=34765 RepID=A0ABN7SQM6_OIKDI|nr:Oidioi.mRNA.OKI2018_I69.chr1.g909.t1.cds [Oikopleura dioica]
MKLIKLLSILQVSFACKKRPKEPEIETTTEITTTESFETTEENEIFEDLSLDNYFPRKEQRPVIPTSYPVDNYDEVLPTTTSIETTSTTTWRTETTPFSTIRHTTERREALRAALISNEQLAGLKTTEQKTITTTSPATTSTTTTTTTTTTKMAKETTISSTTTTTTSITTEIPTTLTNEPPEKILYDIPRAVPVINPNVPISSRRSCWSPDFRYSGTVNVTKTGRACQQWNVGFPHIPKYQPVDLGEGHSFCRNPDGDKQGPWCYTVDPEVRFEYCSIPKCDENGEPPLKQEDCFPGQIGEYSLKQENRLSQTISGLDCQRWDARKPHRPKSAPENSSHNFCSDHDGDAGGAWCYTTDPDVRWEYCPVKYNCEG